MKRVLLTALVLIITNPKNTYADLETFHDYFDGTLETYGNNGNHNDQIKKLSGEFCLGVNNTSGNTDTTAAAYSGKLYKYLENALWENKGNLSYSSNKSRMTEQKWDVYSGYSYNFGINNKWFNSYQIAVDHDQFSNIKYRILPSVGIGYWFENQTTYTWKVNTALGYQFTKFKVANPKSEDRTVALIIENYYKKQILNNTFFSEDLTLVPSLKFETGFRARSITAFSNKINDVFAIEIKYTITYNSKPTNNATSTDREFILGIKYQF